MNISKIMDQVNKLKVSSTTKFVGRSLTYFYKYNVDNIVKITGLQLHITDNSMETLFSSDFPDCCSPNAR